MSLLLFLPLLAQVGPGMTIGEQPASQLPIEIIEKKEKEERERARQAQPFTLPTAPASAKGCMAQVQADPEGSADVARQALQTAVARERVRAGLCLGAALTELQRFGEARDAFVAARDAADDGDHLSRARLGDMAANAELAQNQPAKALLLLAPALTEARASQSPALIAEVQIDRARALVGVNQMAEADKALADARTAQPDNAQSWLLSATLSRRQNNLIAAGSQIQQAAKLAPSDPAIGLEAGVIAMLSKDVAAARRSWQSVVQVAPGSPEAATAQTYLEETRPDDTAAPGPQQPATPN
ncbi:tetratricopeptide repeat protein [Novosphingobium sp. 1949]|uniref:Tetratricopeptide repeat protein n=1 Tax=Novosphingobium organovorum TaxID=2930092 RepID=A0ABT0BIF2_9SPHN|nr:tetratricopeptide repeat protein [Novosphingobium organovorum]MCJ2184638.1 tetratricopeptide repeat protein [Novosphingobium organovorum]